MSVSLSRFTSSVDVQCVPVLLPDDIIVVPQVEPLTVLSGVVDHAHSGHKVHELLGGGVVEVIAALVAPVPVDPVQFELAGRGAAVRHAHSSANSTPGPTSGPTFSTGKKKSVTVLGRYSGMRVYASFQQQII